MSDKGLMIVSPRARARMRLAREATFTFEFRAVSVTTDEANGSVWIVDSRGVLVLPADHERLQLKYAAEFKDEPNA